MKLKRIFYLLVLIALVLVAWGIYNKYRKTGKGKDVVLQYELVTDWPQLQGFVLGNPVGLGVDTSGNVLVFHRAGREWPMLGGMPEELIEEATILLFDKSGKLLRSWGANLFIMPHGLTVDKHNNIWVTDVGLHQVFKFDIKGKLLMKLGEKQVPAKDAKHFNKPTDVTVATDGSFYVSDGYGNSRIIKFSADGKYLFEWGKAGTGEGEFDIPHGITLDEKGNVYVADRGNERVQVFDSTGKFLIQFTEQSFGEICSVAYDEKKNRIIAVDDARFLKLIHMGSDILVFDSAGVVQNRLGRSEHYNGTKCWYHDVAVDKEGNIYVGDIVSNRLQKFRAIK